MCFFVLCIDVFCAAGLVSSAVFCPASTVGFSLRRRPVGLSFVAPPTEHTQPLQLPRLEEILPRPNMSAWATNGRGPERARKGQQGGFAEDSGARPRGGGFLHHNTHHNTHTTEHLFKIFLRDASNSPFDERTKARAPWVFRESQTFCVQRERARGKRKRVVKKERKKE